MCDFIAINTCVVLIEQDACQGKSEGKQKTNRKNKENKEVQNGTAQSPWMHVLPHAAIFKLL
jgi:hypothetical protein